MKLSNVKISLTHHQLQCKQISDSQAFQSTQQSNIIDSRQFLLHRAKLGCKLKNWGYNFTPLRQHRTTTTGSVDFSLIQLWLAVYNRVVDNSEALKFDVVYSFTRWRQNHCSRLLRSNKYIIRGVVWKVVNLLHLKMIHHWNILKKYSQPIFWQL